MAVLGVIGLGRLRACWLLREQAYAPHPNDPELLWLLGDLIIGVAMLGAADRAARALRRGGAR